MRSYAGLHSRPRDHTPVVPGPFRNWRATVLFFYATCTAFLIPLTNE